MALVRILVDGYSLLHDWPELAGGRAPHSAEARDELVRVLTLYQDATHTPITVVFDGNRPHRGKLVRDPEHAVEVLYSKAGQTADQVIERATHLFRAYGEVLAVTNDIAERETVISLGGLASSCLNFVRMVENTLAEQAEDIKHHNRRERHRFENRRRS
jgi:uncharacterized protein